MDERTERLYLTRPVSVKYVTDQYPIRRYGRVRVNAGIPTYPYSQRLRRWSKRTAVQSVCCYHKNVKYAGSDMWRLHDM